MIKGLTMEQFEKELRLNGKVKGAFMNKREVEELKKELNTIEKEVRKEMNKNNDFEMIARFCNTMTMEDIYTNTTDTVEYMDAEVVGIVGQDIEFTDREDLVELPYWCGTSCHSGIRYTESIESPFIQRMY